MGIVSGSDENLIQFIEKTFTGVNQKITELLDCSVKDFVLLHGSFRGFHDLIDQLSGATNTFFKQIKSSNQDIKIEALCSDCSNINTNIREAIEHHLKNFKIAAQDYSFIILSINNLKQILGTLRLLFTNLKFDPVIKINEEEINTCFDSLTRCYSASEVKIKSITNKLNYLISFTEEGFINGLELHIEILNKINHEVQKINAFRKISESKINQLKEIEEQKISSTSEIITNLQFEDILRQKIEHIQAAHEHITSNLYQSHRENKALDQTDLLRIRDISSLQSAQLIHANQEYQKAVENILQRISTLKEVATSYKYIFNQVVKPEQKKFKYIVSTLNEELNLLQTQSYSLNQITDKYFSLIENLEQEQQHIVLVLSDDDCSCNGIWALKKIIDKLEEKISGKKEYNPVHQLKSELKKFQSGLDKLELLFKQINHSQTKKIKASFEKGELDIKQMNESSGEITILLEEFNQILEHTNNQNIKQHTSFEIGVEQVNYYKTFEKEVKEIISHLDKLREKLNAGKSEISEVGLDKLRNMYTMQS